MKRITLSVFAVTFLVIIAPSLTIAQSSIGKATLKGLKGVYVIVETVDQDVEQHGLTKSQITTDAELRLRKAGIRVPKEAESFGDDIGTLLINVSTKSDNSGLYSFSISVDLSQPVCLARAPLTKILGTTYLVTGHIGTVGTENLRELRNVVNDMVDEFLNDYLAINPKP